jgi:queuine tRNA-ribosyltransferase
MLGLEILSIHNLAFYLALVTQARQHILAGDFSAWKASVMPAITARL